MRLKTALAVLVLAGLCLFGCHSSNPTSSGGLNVVITASIANTTLQPTITEGQLLVDGSLVTDNVSPAPTATLALTASGGIASGAHTMSCVIVNQTSSPNNYTVAAPNIQVYDANGNFLKSVTLPTQSGSLATGQAITFSFSL
jgi:hypothetical protein